MTDSAEPVKQATSEVRTDRPNLLERAVRWSTWATGLGSHRGRVICSQFYREVPALRALKDVGRGRMCFIVGNGPSINQMDLSLLKGHDTFAVNAFFLKFDEIPWRPTYYVVEDSLVVQDRAPWLNKLRGTRKIFPRFYDNVLTADEDTTYMNLIMDYTEYADFPRFSTNAAKCLWTGGTVTYVNLQLAFYFGYDPVVLIGVDHNYVVKAEENEIKGAKMTSKTDDINHFHPDYFGKGFRWHDPKVDRMEMAYRRTRQVFEAHGRRVLNATVGGKLEVFERVAYESLFQ